jgi:hypothetical protein
MSPLSTFKMKNRKTGEEEEVRYIEYYNNIKNCPIQKN